VPEEIIEEEAPVEMVVEQEAPVAHEVILVDAEPEPPQPCLFNMIMRDYVESLPIMENGLHDLDDLDDLYDLDDDQMKAALIWMSGFLKMGVMIEIESASLSL
jgi:hypothetical protein